jgi:hypothetical protein
VSNSTFQAPSGWRCQIVTYVLRQPSSGLAPVNVALPTVKPRSPTLPLAIGAQSSRPALSVGFITSAIAAYSTRPALRIMPPFGSNAATQPSTPRLPVSAANARSAASSSGAATRVPRLNR